MGVGPHAKKITQHTQDAYLISLFLRVLAFFNLSPDERQAVLYEQVRLQQQQARTARLETQCKKKLTDVHNAYRSVRFYSALCSLPCIIYLFIRVFFNEGFTERMWC